jgi:hypothetical protein
MGDTSKPATCNVEKAKGLHIGTDETCDFQVALDEMYLICLFPIYWEESSQLTKIFQMG